MNRFKLLLALILWATPVGAVDFRFLLDTSYSMEYRVSDSSGTAYRAIDKANRLLATLLRDWPDTVGVSAVEWSKDQRPLDYYTPLKLASYLSTGYKPVRPGSWLGVALRDEQWEGCVHHVIVTNESPADYMNFEYALKDALEHSSSVTVVLVPYKEPEQSQGLSWYQHASHAWNYHVVSLTGEDATDLRLLREHVMQLTANPGCTLLMM